jgi:hypothetical protein
MKPMKIELIGTEFKAKRVDKENAERFYVAKHYSIPVLSKVVNEFENALLNQAEFDRKGYADFRIGSIFFDLQKTQASSFKNAGRELSQYVEDLTRAHKDDTLRKGVFKHEGETHIDIEDILHNGNHYVYENLQESVKITFDLTKALNERGIISINPGQYKSLTPENAEVYCVAKQQIKLLEKNILKPFKESLCEMSSYGTNSRPFGTEVEMFNVEPYVCMLQTIPRENVNYAKTFKQLKQFVRNADTPVIKGREAMNSETILNFYYGNLAANTTRNLERKAEVFPMPEYMQLVIKG